MKLQQEMPWISRQEYGHAVVFLEELHRLRRLGALFPPKPPLKRSELSLLGVLLHQQKEDPETPVTVGGLARLMRQSVPGVSRKVSVLERHGYVRRAPDAGDRRVYALEVTPEGKQVAETVLREVLGRLETALRQMGEEKTGTLLLLMQELGGVLEQTQKNTGNQTKHDDRNVAN